MDKKSLYKKLGVVGGCCVTGVASTEAVITDIALTDLPAGIQDGFTNTDGVGANNWDIDGGGADFGFNAYGSTVLGVVRINNGVQHLRRTLNSTATSFSINPGSVNDNNALVTWSSSPPSPLANTDFVGLSQTDTKVLYFTFNSDANAGWIYIKLSPSTGNPSGLEFPEINGKVGQWGSISDTFDSSAAPPIPEPSTNASAIGLLALGAMGVSMLRKNRKLKSE